MTPAQAAAERVEAFLAARERWVARGWTHPDNVHAFDDEVLTASDLRALVVAARGGEGSAG